MLVTTGTRRQYETQTEAVPQACTAGTGVAPQVVMPSRLGNFGRRIQGLPPGQYMILLNVKEDGCSFKVTQGEMEK